MSEWDYHLWRREALSGLSTAVQARELVRASGSVSEAVERIGELAGACEKEARFWGASTADIKYRLGASPFDLREDTDSLVSDFFEHLDSIVTKG